MLEEATPGNVVGQLQAMPAKVKSPMLTCIRTMLEHKDNKAYCERLLANYEVDAEKELGQCRSLLKLGPMLGLMGTLIPMGPGLAALGAGDVNTLANAIIVAFDTTVVGIGAGAVAYFVSKVRRRWYEEYLSNLDALADALLDKLSQ